jgi:VCBS repeat-containing protein
VKPSRAGRQLQRRSLRVELLEPRRVLAQISGLVFVDDNGDGVAGQLEAPLANRLVYLDLNTNGQPDPSDRISVTGADGQFEFNDLEPGDYVISLFDGTQRQTQTFPIEGAQVVSVKADVPTPPARFGVQLSGPNESPDLSALFATLAEDSTLAADLVDLGIADPDGDQLLMFVTRGPRHGTLSSWNTDGSWQYQPDADFEGVDQFEVLISDGQSTQQNVTISLNVEGINDAPRSIDVTPSPLVEFARPGDEVGRVSIDDPDVTADYAISLGDQRFVADGLRILVAANAIFDFELEPFISFVVTAFDRSVSQDTIEGSGRVEVQDQDDPVRGILLHGSAVPENEVGAFVGTLVVLDQDGRGNITVTLDDDRFEYVDGTIRLRPASSLDFESESLVRLGVVVHELDSPGRIFRGEVKIDVLDVNERPLDLVGGFNPLTERLLGAHAGSILVIDRDAGDAHRLEVDDPRFVITNGVLKLRDDVAVSRSEETHIVIRVTATDRGDLQLSKEFTLVVGANDYPWHNGDLDGDVDGDGKVQPRDVVLIINQLNNSGGGSLGDPYPIVDGDHRYLDVNSDGLLTPLDALIIINVLNRQSMGEGEGSSGGGERLAQSSSLPMSPPSGADSTKSSARQKRNRGSASKEATRDVWGLALTEYLRDSHGRRSLFQRRGRS